VTIYEEKGRRPLGGGRTSRGSNTTPFTGDTAQGKGSVEGRRRGRKKVRSLTRSAGKEGGGVAKATGRRTSGRTKGKDIPHMREGSAKEERGTPGAMGQPLFLTDTIKQEGGFSNLYHGKVLNGARQGRTEEKGDWTRS